MSLFSRSRSIRLMMIPLPLKSLPDDAQIPLQRQRVARPYPVPLRANPARAKSCSERWCPMDHRDDLRRAHLKNASSAPPAGSRRPSRFPSGFSPHQHDLHLPRAGRETHEPHRIALLLRDEEPAALVEQMLTIPIPVKSSAAGGRGNSRRVAQVLKRIAVLQPPRHLRASPAVISGTNEQKALS